MNIYLLLRLEKANLTNLALFIFSLRVFWTRAPVFVKLFSGLCFLEVVADIIEWVSNQGRVLTITNNSLALAEIVIYTFIFLQIIHSRTIGGYLV